MIPEFTSTEKEATSVLLKYRNDILIYTEDKMEDHEFYIHFYKNLLKDTGIRINDVFQIGSCIEVEQAYRNDVNPKNPTVYIIDGDIFLSYCPKCNYDRFFVLKRYCVENYLIEEIPFIHAAHIFLGMSEKDIQYSFNYEHEMKELSKYILPLFIFFSLSHEHLGHFNLEDNSFGRIFDQKRGVFKEDEINKIENDIIEKLEKEAHLTEYQIIKEYQKRLTLYSSKSDSVKHIVSGKSYIFPFLKNRLKNQLNCGTLNVPIEGWKMNCADKADLSELNEIKQKIIELCK